MAYRTKLRRKLGVNNALIKFLAPNAAVHYNLLTSQYFLPSIRSCIILLLTLLYRLSWGLIRMILRLYTGIKC